MTQPKHPTVNMSILEEVKKYGVTHYRTYISGESFKTKSGKIILCSALGAVWVDLVPTTRFHGWRIMRAVKRSTK